MMGLLLRVLFTLLTYTDFYKLKIKPICTLLKQSGSIFSMIFLTINYQYKHKSSLS